MGNKESKNYPRYKYSANGEAENQTAQSLEDFERRWEVFMQSLDVGPERIRQIEELDPKQKRELLSNFESNNPKCSAFHYVTLIKGLRSGRVGQSTSKKKEEGQNSKEVLSATEISLRTNNVDWVYDFLNHQGLDVLVDYMSKTIHMLLRFGEMTGVATLPRHRSTVAGQPVDLASSGAGGGANEIRSSRARSLGRSARPPPLANEAMKDSLHLGLKCFRAILNNQRGCSLAFEHAHAINVVTLCLLHPNYQTKTLVLELLAAVCLIDCGHDKVLKAFDNFKGVTGENRLFETLMYFFCHHETLSLENYSIDYMVSCMQFLNIVVHSVDQDINLRVYLQHLFKILGLEEFIKKLQERPGDRLNRQADAYVDNLVDCGVLLEDSETKETYLSENERLERELAAALEQTEGVDEETRRRMEQLQQRLAVMQAEIFNFKAREDQQKNMTSALQRRIDDMDRSASDREKDLEQQIMNLQADLAAAQTRAATAVTEAETAVIQLEEVRLANLASQPIVPPRRNLAATDGTNISPTPPSLSGLPALPTLPTCEPATCKLPPVSWAVLRPQYLTGTLFASLENLGRLQQAVDFHRFEEIFHVGDDEVPAPRRMNGFDETDSTVPADRKSLVDVTRHKALTSLLHYLDSERLTLDFLRRSVEALALSPQAAERLLPHLPSPAEVAMYRNFEAEESTDQLSDADQLLLNLCRMDHLPDQIRLIQYMASFEDLWRSLHGKVRVLSAASQSIRKSAKLRKILELVLVVGNYANGGKRGLAYGFRLQSLDLLSETRSTDKKWTLLHFLAQTIEEKFSDLLDFNEDLTCIEEASKIPLDSIIQESTLINCGMTAALHQMAAAGHAAPPVLAEFVRTNQNRAEQVCAEAEAARTVFLQSAEWFGERANTASPDLMFAVVLRFVDSFKKAVSENSKRRRSEPSAISSGDGHSHSKKKERKETQEAKKHSRRKKNRTRQINADGIMDEIMAGLGDQPLQAGVHRKVRSTPTPGEAS